MMCKDRLSARKFVAILFLVLSPWTMSYEIERVRLGDTDEKTRIVVETSKPTNYKVFTLENPGRIVVDFEDAKLSSDFKIPSLIGASIVEFAQGIPRNNVARLVFYTPKVTANLSHFTLESTSKKPYRTIVDIKHNRQAQTIANFTGPADRKILIAIDAGHGGKDPGAIGPNRLKEKDIVLSIAKQLAIEIDRTPGFESYLVRNDDRYLELYQRRELARKKNADLFVSIHADAFTKPQANGASVYMVSTKSATSAMARYLAKNSNGSIAGVSLKNRDPIVSQILSSMSLEGSMQASRSIGELILPELSQVARLHSRRVEQAPFAVLKSPDMPSLLIETGFISNPRESSKLATSWYRAKLARAIHSGITSYFNQMPPVDTWLYAQRRPDSRIIQEPTQIAQTLPRQVEIARIAKPTPTQKYVVQSGDTLSEIAALYAMNTSELREMNNLSGNNIRAGETLSVPSTGIGSIDYEVRPGDTLSEIAHRFGVSPRALAKHNRVNKGLIKIGQHLEIPVDEPLEYTVRTGDTLSEIAVKFSVKLSDIKRFNALSGETIRLGQILKIPASS